MRCDVCGGEGAAIDRRPPPTARTGRIRHYHRECLAARQLQAVRRKRAAEATRWETAGQQTLKGV